MRTMIYLEIIDHATFSSERLPFFYEPIVFYIVYIGISCKLWYTSLSTKSMKKKKITMYYWWTNCNSRQPLKAKCRYLFVYICDLDSVAYALFQN